jgi:hypothetical protein
VQIAIDFGEIEAGLQAIMAAGVAFTHQRTMDAFTEYAANTGHSAFGLRADQVSPSIAHMYEWGQVGNPAGRLWVVNWTSSSGKRTGQLAFLPSKLHRPKEDWQLQREADEGISFGQRVWPNKAMEQETRAAFRWAPGAPKRGNDKPGIGKGGREIARTEFIVNYSGGRLIFSKRPITVRNEYQGRMTALWAAFWGTEWPKRMGSVVPKVEKEYGTLIEADAMRSIAAARGVSRMPVARPGETVSITSRRRPFTGKINVNPSKQQVDRLVGRMVQRWRRQGKTSSTLT